MVAAESTFLTSLNADRRAATEKAEFRQKLLGATDGGDKILELHKDLQALADDLDERVEAKLQANETAFFLAYKSFMQNVQKEFKELKQKADEEETKTRRDAKIQSLEKELDWFMHEALRLDELCKKHKKDLDKWKSRAEALEDDRQFLENSIKTAKRTNKSLRGAVEKAQTSAYSALVAADDMAGSRSMVPVSTGPPAIMQDVPQSQRALEDRASPLPIQDGMTASGLSRELEERYQSCVKKLKQQLESEQRMAAKLRAVSDRQFGEPSELESFFLDCVDQVKHDIGERRKQTQAATQSKSRGRPEAPTTVMGPPAVSLDDFTVSDRRKVIELLLSSEQVLQFLYDKLFPPAEGGY
eukprot:CAMPEP_0176050158 /NCGR_PEP_ID=MMETSP0120_2-20121206/24929_1 /TAXON_ID=160619 /ORGANISM="Kryptoperidinium foliaceum, Strain CCMP 1326" /LENGTH=356 /DNA_ID=CAMNT_0017383591 /DNA_START=1 /DNA_END=1071 /DNA_ORIENTATION=+